jgi:DNA-binding XRE family transcriptional regulator
MRARPGGGDEVTKEERAALRRELYVRVDRVDVGLVETIKTMRKIVDKTQVEYAQLVGVSPRILKEMERGVGNPTLDTIRKILRPFRLDVGVRRTS